MKKININLIAASFLSLLSLSSCLKDDDHYVDFSAQPVIVEIPKAGFSTKVLENQEAAQDLNITVNVASPFALDHEVVATLAFDAAAITKYNAAEAGRTFEMIPASAIQVPSYKVTIPAGQRQATFTVKVLAKQLDENKKFMLPVKLTEASGLTVSGNFNTALVSFALKNIYDGEYHSTGYFEHPTAASSRAISEDKTLSTIDANTVLTTYADLGYAVWLRVDKATNKVTMITPANSSVPATHVLVNQDADDNTYNPTTHTFKLRYKYNGAGGDRKVNETIVLIP